MRELKTNKVFFSVGQVNQTNEINQANHSKVKSTLKTLDIPFIELHGVWKGQHEMSFLLQSNDIKLHNKYLQLAIETGKTFNQDAILEVHNDDAAILHDLTSGYNTEKVGTLVLTSEKPIDQDSYSFEPITKTYFTIE